MIRIEADILRQIHKANLNYLHVNSSGLVVLLYDT